MIMKQFNLEEYLKNPNKKVVTRDGRKVTRFLCTDIKNEFPIVVAVESCKGAYPEELLTYRDNGAFYNDDTIDIAKEMGFDRSTICHGRLSAESSLKYIKGYKERYQELERRCEELV